MKKHKFFITGTLVLIAALVAGCLPGKIGLPSAPRNASEASSTATPAAPRPSATALPTLPPTAAPTGTTDPQQMRVDQAAQTAVDYFNAISEGNSAAAVELLSSFSLMVFQMTRSQAAELLQAQYAGGQRWSDFKLLDTQTDGDVTLLLHVRYTETAGSTQATSTTQAAAGTPSTVEAVWPMRLEQGVWRYNWNDLVDFHTLNAKAQAVNDITILPVQMNRYSDHLDLVMLVQNHQNQLVVFGQNNETLGIFHFGDQRVTAEKNRWVLNALRSTPDVTLTAQGYYETYPDSVEIRKWDNTNTAPWYTFQFEPGQ